MAAEGGELTFVRCSSCRSLVPAVSTRCRWCGHALGGNATEAAREEPQTRRVRQKTRSIQAGEYTPQPTREKAGAEQDDLNDEGMDNNDPLRGFIEEIEDEVDDEISEEELLSALNEEQNSYANREKGYEDKNSAVLSNEDLDEGEVSNELPLDEYISDELQAFDEGIDDNLTDINIPDTPVSNGVYHVDSSATESFRAREQSENSPLIESSKGSTQEGAVLGVKIESFSKSEERRGPYREFSKQEEKTVSRIEEPVGKLFGWLVSYASPEGRAFELRESRFFISASNLKGNDLVIDDPSVSTPHAMVNIGRDKGFAIQDLMSERGVFIKRKGQESYRREDGVIKCSNGDWIRIGDVEYLLTVVSDL